jgi:hypothetical protein
LLKGLHPQHMRWGSRLPFCKISKPRLHVRWTADVFLAGRLPF